jgi:hypothetical protein
MEDLLNKDFRSSAMNSSYSAADNSVRYTSTGSIYTENPCDSVDIAQIVTALNLTQKQRSLVMGYLKLGWAVVSRLYRKRTTSKDDMILLGRVRTLMVDTVFECYRHDNVYMDAFGTTGVTSDYDVSLMGANSHLTMWNMFESFIKHYHSALPVSFDTNLYNNGMYEATQAKGSVEGMSKLEFPDKHKYSAFTLTPADDACRATMLKWALVKVVEGVEAMNGDIDEYVRAVLPVSVTRHLDAAVSCLAGAKKMRTDAYSVAHEYYKGKFKFGSNESAEYHGDSYDDSEFDSHDDPRYEEFLKVVVEYGLQFHYAKLLNARLYENVDHLRLKELGGFLERLLPTIEPETMSTPELLCRNMFFSVEAAYTQGAVNVVVHEMQAGKRLTFDKADYLCAMVENYGELLKHVGTGSASLPEKALKYSKYVYRILYAAGKYLKNDALMEEAATVKREVVSKRDENMTDINILNHVYLTYPTPSLDTYLKAVASKVRAMFESEQTGGSSGFAASWLCLGAVTVAMALFPA